MSIFTRAKGPAAAASKRLGQPGPADWDIPGLGGSMGTSQSNVRGHSKNDMDGLLEVTLMFLYSNEQRASPLPPASG